MSGGSWEYAHEKVRDVAERLLAEDYPPRIALGRALLRFAEALHDIEWEDSGDYGPGRSLPAMEKALGPRAHEFFATEAVAKLRRQIEDAKRFADGVSIP